MTWLDLAIIYVACGTPFAVYRLALTEHDAKETSLRSLRAGLLWPVVGAKTIITRFYLASRGLNGSRLDTIRSEMEAILLAESSSQVYVFEFREMFDRFAGLATAANTHGPPPARALQAIAHTDSSPITEACLHRIQRGKLERHLTAARAEFQLWLSANRHAGLDELASSLAVELCDDVLPNSLYPASQGLRHVTSVSRSTI